MANYDNAGFCYECRYYRDDEKHPIDGWCVKHHGVAGKPCCSFKITKHAVALRYANARRTSRRAGIGYDADLSRFNSYPVDVKAEIRELLAGRVAE